ncbi:MAG: hypothetical protein ABIA91_00490 [Patescibacteria group bacterium]
MSTFSVKTIQPKRDFSKFKKDISDMKKSTSKKHGKGKYFILVFVLIILYVLFTFILPNVRVTVFLSAEEFSKEYDILLQRDAVASQGEKLVYPAEIRKLSGTEGDTFEATGEKNIGEKARATANIYNYTGRSAPVTSKVELIHSSGKKYFLTQTVTVPGASVSDIGEVVPGEITVEVEASEAGEDFNQSSGRLNISVLTLEMQGKIYVEAQEFTGGTSEVVQVVSQEDLDNAQEDLIDKLTPDLKDKLKDELKKTNLVIRDELADLKIINIEKSSDLDGETNEFTMKIEAEIQALVFKEEELKKFLKSTALIDLPDNKMIAKDDLGQLTFDIEDFNLDNETADLKAQIKYDIFPQVDLDGFKELIKGKPQNDARRIIMQQDNVKDVRFDFSLSLSNKVPNNLNKIDVRAGN